MRGWVGRVAKGRRGEREGGEGGEFLSDKIALRCDEMHCKLSTQQSLPQNLLPSMLFPCQLFAAVALQGNLRLSTFLLCNFVWQNVHAPETASLADALSAIMLCVTTKFGLQRKHISNSSSIPLLSFSLLSRYEALQSSTVLHDGVTHLESLICHCCAKDTCVHFGVGHK